MPSKLAVVDVSDPLPLPCWTTGSFAVREDPCAATRFSDSPTFTDVTTGIVGSGRSATALETPRYFPFPTFGPNVPADNVDVACAASFDPASPAGASRSTPTTCASASRTGCAASRPRPALNASSVAAAPRTATTAATLQVLRFMQPP